MKNACYCLAFLLLFAACTHAQTEQPIPPAPAAPSSNTSTHPHDTLPSPHQHAAAASDTLPPKKQAVKPTIAFATELHDFGDIKAGSDASYTFRVINTGTTPLTIFSAKGSCGCTQVQATTKPIPPQKTGEVVVSYHADADDSGKFTKLVTVYSNAETKLRRLTIKGNVIPK